ncbi:MAG: hypothetical protein Q9210_001304 [Variospora velana]
MSSQFNEIADIPREFLREGTQFMNRCAKPDKREFIKISQAVGIGFVVMGAIGIGKEPEMLLSEAKARLAKSTTFTEFGCGPYRNARAWDREQTSTSSPNAWKLVIANISIERDEKPRSGTRPLPATEDLLRHTSSLLEQGFTKHQRNDDDHRQISLSHHQSTLEHAHHHNCPNIIGFKLFRFVVDMISSEF